MHQLIADLIAKEILHWKVEFPERGYISWLDKNNQTVADATIWNPFDSEEDAKQVLNHFETHIVDYQEEKHIIKIFHNHKWYVESDTDFKKAICLCVLKANQYDTKFYI